MTPPEHSDRDRNSDFQQRLPTEAARWQSAGIITPEQAHAIRALYPPAARNDDAGGDHDHPAGDAIAGRAVSVIAIMGSALVGLGIIAFIAANWSGMPTLGRLALLIGGTPAIYAAGWLLAHRFGCPRVGTAVILLGAVSYGASLHLIAQIYHLPLYHPNLMPAWFLGVLPLAYIERSRALLTLALVLFLAAALFRAPVWQPDLGSEGAMVALLSGYLALGALLFAAGRWHSRIQRLAPLARFYDLAGLLTAATIIYLAGFHLLWENASHWLPPLMTAEYWAVMAAAVVATAALTIHAARRRRGAIRWETAALAFLGATVALLWLSAARPLLWLVGPLYIWPASWFWIIFNLLLLAGIIGMIVAGYRRNRAWLINLAVAIFAVTLFTRYFEFGFGLLGQSLAFIVTGITLLAGGLALEYLRRRMLRRMSARPGSPTGTAAGGTATAAAAAAGTAGTAAAGATAGGTAE